MLNFEQKKTLLQVDWNEKLKKDVFEANPSLLAFLRVPFDDQVVWKNWKSLNRTVTDLYHSDLCKKIQNEDRIKITVAIKGSTFMALKRSLRVSFTDKLGSIGGTMGLFSGFSLLAIMELIHWICKVASSVIVTSKK